MNETNETPLIHLKFKDFKNLWIKDESVNPTGTHKDRMADAILKLYQEHIVFCKSKAIHPKFPVCSLISAGNAAIAIARKFLESGLPKLKVLIDANVSLKTIQFLQKNHCEVYRTDLTNKKLSIENILSLTDNHDGIDLTSFTNLDNSLFYADLVADVISHKPKTVLIPYGSGVLFENFCKVLRNYHYQAFDPNNLNIHHLKTQKQFVSTNLTLNDFNINLIGVTTNNGNSKANKLFSAYAPFDFNYQRLDFLLKMNFIGEKSAVECFNEAYLNDAMKIFNEKGIAAEYSGAAAFAYFLEKQSNFDKNQLIIIINTGKGLVDD
jgi:hypothetical protein